MTAQGIGHDYEISDELWKKIEPLLPQPKPKKKSGRPRKDDWVHQALCMIDFRNGGKPDYLRKCGKQV